MNTLEQWIPSIASLISLLVIFFVVEKVLLRLLKKLAKHTTVTWDDLLLDRIQSPLLTGLFFIAFSIAFSLAPSRVKEVSQILLVIKAALLLTGAWALDRIIGVFLKELPALKQLGASPQSLLRNIFRGILFAVTALGCLDTFGFSITPLLASLGVGSIAVALALQETLSNFFSGIYILADQPVRVDDYVQLENGTEGYITKIGWRSTHLLQLTNNIVVIPNSKLGSSQIINYNLTDSESTFKIEMGVAYGSDLEKVERVVAEVGKQIMNTTSGGVSSFNPYIRFHTFADSSINFNVLLRGQNIVDQYLIKHEFIKAVHARFNQEGIEIPFPQRVIHNSK